MSFWMQSAGAMASSSIKRIRDAPLSVEVPRFPRAPHRVLGCESQSRPSPKSGRCASSRIARGDVIALPNGNQCIGSGRIAWPVHETRARGGAIKAGNRNAGADAIYRVQRPSGQRRLCSSRLISVDTLVGRHGSAHPRMSDATHATLPNIQNRGPRQQQIHNRGYAHFRGQQDPMFRWISMRCPQDNRGEWNGRQAGFDAGRQQARQ